MKDPVTVVTHTVEHPPFYTTGAFALLLAAVALSMFVIGTITLLFLAGLPPSAQTAAIGVIMGVAGPLLGLLGVLVRQQFTNEVTAATAQLVNGHLELHDNDVPLAPPPPASGPGA